MASELGAEPDVHADRLRDVDAEGGELVVDGDVPDEQYLELIVEPVPSFAIETAYRIDGSRPRRRPHKVVVRGFDSSPAGVANFECGVVTSDVGTGDVVALETNLNGTSADAHDPAFSTRAAVRERRVRDQRDRSAAR